MRTRLQVQQQAIRILEEAGWDTAVAIERVEREFGPCDRCRCPRRKLTADLMIDAITWKAARDEP